MLHEHTLAQLRTLRLDGMIAALTDPATMRAGEALPFADQLATLVQREIDWRDGKRLQRLLKAAKLKVSSACIEDIRWRAGRNLDRHLVTALASCDWIRHARTVLLTGATGTGKTWLACALGQQAARGGFSVLYTRTTRLLQELQTAHGDGSFSRRMTQLAHVDLLLLDDRVGVKATLITSQLAVNAWHAWIDEPTVADAILDRLVHTAQRIELQGPSLRKPESTAP